MSVIGKALHVEELKREKRIKELGVMISDKRFRVSVDSALIEQMEKERERLLQKVIN